MFLISLIVNTLQFMLIVTPMAITIWFIRAWLGLLTSGTWVCRIPIVNILPLSEKSINGPMNPFKFIGTYGDKTRNSVSGFLGFSLFLGVLAAIVSMLDNKSFYGLCFLYGIVTYSRMASRIEPAVGEYENLNKEAA